LTRWGTPLPVTHRRNDGRKVCSHCGARRDSARRSYCRRCRRAYDRARSTDPLRMLRRKVQATARRALAKGLITREPCRCGARAQMHHRDYSKPLEVLWLCAGCHAHEYRIIRRFLRELAYRERPITLSV